MDRRSFLTLGGAAVAGLVPARLLAAEAKAAGTHFHHCHWGTLPHMQAGMFGSFSTARGAIWKSYSAATRRVSR